MLAVVAGPEDGLAGHGRRRRVRAPQLLRRGTCLVVKVRICRSVLQESYFPLRWPWGLRVKRDVGSVPSLTEAEVTVTFCIHVGRPYQ